MGLAVAVLLLSQAGLLAHMAARCSPTIDEPAHLAAGLSHWTFGRFDLYHVNPPLVRMLAALPVWLANPRTDWSSFTELPYARPEFTIGRAFANANGRDVFRHVTVARWTCIPLILVGGYFCYRWARDLYSTTAGLVALALWCFCPNVLGNGALITPDAACAAMGTMAAYFFWRWLEAPGWVPCWVAGLTLGLALLTKSTWSVLILLWPSLWFAWRLSMRPVGDRLGSADHAVPHGDGAASRRQHQRGGPQSAVQLLIILLIALHLVNLAYAMENSFQRLDQFDFISRALGGSEAHEVPGNRFGGTWLGAVPVPLPAKYVQGIDVQHYEFEKGKWSYLRGEQKLGGWWYYYLYALSVKVPIGTLFLFALTCTIKAIGVGRACKCRRLRCLRPDERALVLSELVLLTPAFAVLILVSSQTGFSRYLRYVLPAFPFLFIWISQSACVLYDRPRRRAPSAVKSARSRVRYLSSALVFVPLIAAIISSLRCAPHSLSYFNELAGGPLNGPAHLLDANIDWGQDLLELARWRQSNSGAVPLHVAYFGAVSPESAGIVCKPVP